MEWKLYDIKNHRLNFSLWAAARAAMAGSAKASRFTFTTALLKSGIINFLDEFSENNSSNITQEIFNKHHHEWCKGIIKNANLSNEHYGIAAKLVAVFIKSYYTINQSENEITKYAHPPIDSHLLKSIDRDRKSRLSKKYKWQKMDKAQYIHLISELRKIIKEEPFWKIERYWDLNITW
jgi:hypothetical protein